MQYEFGIILHLYRRQHQTNFTELHHELLISFIQFTFYLCLTINTSLSVLILVAPNYLLENLAWPAVVETGVNRIECIHWVVIDCIESIVIEIHLEICLFAVIDKKLELLSLLLLLLFMLSTSFLHWLFLFLERRNLFFYFGILLIF